MDPTDKPEAQFARLRRAALRYAICLALLAIPSAISFVLRGQSKFSPLISFCFIAVVTFAGWWAGAFAGILVSFAILPAITAVTTAGRSFIPPTLDPVGMSVLVIIAVLASRVAAARRRAENVLRSANEELEAGVRERTAELESARDWLRTTLASIGDAVIATDREGRVSFMNRVSETLTGWREADAIGRPLTDIFVIVDETTRKPAENPVDKVLRTGAVAGLANHTVLIARDGREIPIDDSAAPIRGTGERIAGIVLVFRDITERRASEKSKEQARIALERANQELQEFAYAASHDLQEPLRNVSIYTEMLGDRYRGKLDPEADRYIAITVSSVRRMQNLLRDLLAYNQAAVAGDREVVPTDAKLALEHVLPGLQTAIRESGAAVVYDGLPSVLMDEVHVQQLFQNLIGNAIKYRSKEPPRIHISAAREGAEWVFRVSDNGIGIDPKYSKLIFRVFKRLHGKDEYPGTGVGLAICEKIVQRYGGRIWMESEPGQGSTFLFAVPAAAEKKESAAGD
ncbi:MAG TPA: ATP-binding protein [Bryobacteraceae bacterium]|nr:ATP-binding protein [Bryobacteraceae bacterium]